MLAQAGLYGCALPGQALLRLLDFLTHALCLGQHLRRSRTCTCLSCAHACFHELQLGTTKQLMKAYLHREAALIML